jgi:hypothetical protein
LLVASPGQPARLLRSRVILAFRPLQINTSAKKYLIMTMTISIMIVVSVGFCQGRSRAARVESLQLLAELARSHFRTDLL